MGRKKKNETKSLSTRIDAKLKLEFMVHAKNKGFSACELIRKLIIEELEGEK